MNEEVERMFQTTMEARMKPKDWIEAGMPIALCAVTFGVSAWLSLTHDDPEWFQRAGSVIVCLSVWLEIQQQLAKAPVVNNSLILSGKPALSAPDVPKARKALHWISWTGLFIGTIIWGYGDLLFQFLLSA